MEVILLGIYAFFAWLVFFKFKWLPWNFTSMVITITLPIVGLICLFLLLNICAPTSDDVRAMNYVIPIVPRVTGQVTEVPIEPNRPIKKGDVLFKIDPVPFEAVEKAAEATLAMNKVKLVTAQADQRGLEDQLKQATAKKAALTPRIDLAKKRVEQFTSLAATGAGKRADLEQAQSDQANLESEFQAADATESQVQQKLSAKTENGDIDEVAQAKAQIAKSEADLRGAQYDLDGCVHVAPSDGRVANLAVQPGVRATQFATMSVMSFIQEDNPWLLAFYRQNELRYVEPGDEAEVFVKMYPGRIIKCKVDSILWATAQGQMPLSGNLPNTAPMSAPEQRIAVRLVLDEREHDLFLAAGARGGGAIYTEHHQAIQILRRVIIRVQAKLDWFVLKHLGALLEGGHH
jgi:multidrug resistance efflux pump